MKTDIPAGQAFCVKRTGLSKASAFTKLYINRYTDSGMMRKDVYPPETAEKNKTLSPVCNRVLLSNLDLSNVPFTWIAIALPDFFRYV
jgi:hypothetical protein